MVDGKYQVILKTPMGAKRGELTLKSEDGILTGSMIALGKDNAIMPGTVNDDEFQFSGELRTAVGKLALRVFWESGGQCNYWYSKN